MITNKVFVVGLNKTGTTSFHRLFCENGLKSYHNPDWQKRIKDDQDNEIENYQCFSDGYAYDFALVADKYPDAVFVLSTRSLRAWIVSRFKHGYGTLNAEKIRSTKEMGQSNWAYPPTMEKMISWIEQRNHHHTKVLDHFVDQPSRLYVVDIEKANWEAFVGKAFCLNVTAIRPANVRPSKAVPIISEIETLVDSVFEELGYSKEQIEENLAPHKNVGMYVNNF